MGVFCAGPAVPWDVQSPAPVDMVIASCCYLQFFLLISRIFFPEVTCTVPANSASETQWQLPIQLSRIEPTGTLNGLFRDPVRKKNYNTTSTAVFLYTGTKTGCRFFIYNFCPSYRTKATLVLQGKEIGTWSKGNKIEKKNPFFPEKANKQVMPEGAIKDCYRMSPSIKEIY